MSCVHASGFVYCDNHSTNGTYYNGHLLKSGVLCYLKDGDVLYIHGKEDERTFISWM